MADEFDDDEIAESGDVDGALFPAAANQKLLTCPIRGPLTVAKLASDGLTLTEESRRIDLIRLLLDRGYPAANIAAEVAVIKNIGEKGRNRVRADLLVYDRAVMTCLVSSDHR